MARLLMACRLEKEVCCRFRQPRQTDIDMGTTLQKLVGPPASSCRKRVLTQT